MRIGAAGPGATTFMLEVFILPSSSTVWRVLIVLVVYEVVGVPLSQRLLSAASKRKAEAATSSLERSFFGPGLRFQLPARTRVLSLEERYFRHSSRETWAYLLPVLAILLWTDIALTVTLWQAVTGWFGVFVYVLNLVPLLILYIILLSFLSRLSGRRDADATAFHNAGELLVAVSGQQTLTTTFANSTSYKLENIAHAISTSITREFSGAESDVQSMGRAEARAKAAYIRSLKAHVFARTPGSRDALLAELKRVVWTISNAGPRGLPTISADAATAPIPRRSRPLLRVVVFVITVVIVYMTLAWSHDQGYLSLKQFKEAVTALIATSITLVLAAALSGKWGAETEG
jgi:hypothetical protein